MLNNFFDIQDEFNFETEKQNLINNTMKGNKISEKMINFCKIKQSDQ